MVSPICTVTGSRTQSLILHKFTVNCFAVENISFSLLLIQFQYTVCLDPLTYSYYVSPLPALESQRNWLFFYKKTWLLRAQKLWYKRTFSHMNLGNWNANKYSMQNMYLFQPPNKHGLIIHLFAYLHSYFHGGGS